MRTSSRHPFPPDEFRSVYSKVPRLTVGVVVQTPKGIVLTLRTLDSWKGQWHIPGGTVFYKETIEEAIRRVAHEELGVNVTMVRLLGFLHYPSEEKERGFGWTIELNFLCRHLSGMLRDSEQGKVGVFHELPENTIQEAKAFLQKHLKLKTGPPHQQ